MNIRKSLARRAGPESGAGKGRLPRVERDRVEPAVWGVLALATTVAVVQFFAGMARFAERAPGLAGQFRGLRPAFVQQLMASMPTNRLEWGTPTPGAATVSMPSRRTDPAG